MAHTTPDYTVWGGRRGEPWAREWQHVSGPSTYTGDPIVEIRCGETETSRLVASSYPDREAPDVALVDVSGSDLPSGLLALTVADTDKIPAGAYWVGVKADRTGSGVVEIVHRQWAVGPQVAVLS